MYVTEFTELGQTRVVSSSPDLSIPVAGASSRDFNSPLAVAQVTPHQWATIMRWSTAFSEAKREMWPAYS
jgi:hypothetical protein